MIAAAEQATDKSAQAWQAPGAIGVACRRKRRAGWQRVPCAGRKGRCGRVVAAGDEVCERQCGSRYGRCARV